MSLKNKTNFELWDMLVILNNLRKNRGEAGNLLKYQIHQEIIRRGNESKSIT